MLSPLSTVDDHITKSRSGAFRGINHKSYPKDHDDGQNQFGLCVVREREM